MEGSDVGILYRSDTIYPNARRLSLHLESNSDRVLPTLNRQFDVSIATLSLECLSPRTIPRKLVINIHFHTRVRYRHRDCPTSAIWRTCDQIKQPIIRILIPINL